MKLVLATFLLVGLVLSSSFFEASVAAGSSKMPPLAHAYIPLFS
jgi:hypothetical protein